MLILKHNPSGILRVLALCSTLCCEPFKEDHKMGDIVISRHLDLHRELRVYLPIESKTASMICVHLMWNDPDSLEFETLYTDLRMKSKV
jgi:hypothetical protein